MFISQTHLPQLLSPDHYRHADQLAIELEKLFLPAWHCLGTLSDVPHSGDYFTRTLLERPLLVRHGEQGIQAYLNVCTHRFCELRSDSCGNMPKLKCQYHGWEFNDSGDTQRIPDAKSFRPLKKGVLGLKTFPTETVGQLIFVSLAENPPPLREYLGPGYELCQQLYSGQAEQILAVDRPNHANWKVSLENSLEGYHLETVHADTFRMYPPDSHCHHELFEGRSSLRVASPGPKTKLERLGDLLFKLAGVNSDTTYYQFHVYPNLVFAKFGMFSWLEVVLPDTPDDSHDIWRFFSNIRTPGRYRSYLPAAILRRWGRKWFKQVIGEDEAIFPAIQAGLNSPHHPGSGLVSTREERVFHFQKYLLDNASAFPASIPSGPFQTGDPADQLNSTNDESLPNRTSESAHVS
ncbi:aromatic ring-hydroxylating oxygenase subunit alpha [Planctomycetaceae bacterium SH139]